jgi:hypothetical protein
MGHHFVFGQPNFKAEDWDQVTCIARGIADWYKQNKYPALAT